MFGSQVSNAAARAALVKHCQQHNTCALNDHMVDEGFDVVPTLAANVVNTPDLSTLLAAATAAGLVETLSGTKVYTVFAPDNQAFADIQETVDKLLRNPIALKKVLLNHVVEGAWTADNLDVLLDSHKTLTTLGGSVLHFGEYHNDGLLHIQAGGTTASARVLVADVLSANGVAHVISRVLA